jgi:hypothetical protein
MAIEASVLGKLKNFNNIRQKQVILPVSKSRAVTSPLTVRDDLSLRTMVVSPDVYDDILCKLMYRHTEFIDMVLQDGTTYKFEEKPTYEQFQTMVSEFDKKSILWGIYASTYESFGKQNITCPSCQDKWEEVVTAEQIVTPESFTTWVEPEAFTKYAHSIDIPVENDPNIKGFRFNTGVPNIKEHLNVLKLVTSEKMKDNFDKFGKILSSSEELSLITRSIDIVSNVVLTDEQKASDEEFPTETFETVQGLFNVYEAINDYIPLNIIDDVAKKYDKKFSKYIPTFKKPITCRKCAHDFDFPVDIELALFRSFLRL